MPQFMKKTGCKVLGAILCILLLAAGLFFGILTLVVAGYGGFTSQSALYDGLVTDRLSRDTDVIMNGYFDPNDPTHPWASYYSGSIFTGDNSNLLWTITKDGSDTPVLSTYDGEDSMTNLSSSFSYSTTESSPRDVYTIDSQLFYCDGTLYTYSEGYDQFSPVKSGSTQKISGIESYPDTMQSLGFTYNGSHYAYEDEEAEPGFYWAGNDTLTYTTVDTTYTITCYLLKDMPYNDQYRKLYLLSNTLYWERYVLCGITAGLLIPALILLVLLCCTVGRVNGKDEAVLNPIHKIPGELALIPVILFPLLGLSMVDSNFSYYQTALIGLGFGCAISAPFLVYFFVTLCARVKTHTLLHNTLCARLWHFLRKAGKSASAAGAAVFLHLPLIWKVMGAYLALCLLEFIGLGLFYYGSGTLYFFWIAEKLLLGGILAYVCMSFLRLKSGAERISAGDYNTKVSTEHLVLEFKSTAETLNHIQDGINTAVESRMRSERLKTELITNVSHDLKTPLTSIVSYVDLLKQEPAGSPAAAEYLQVLDRQSARLKKLIEDLVEASKASTGNITVHAEPLDFSMMLGQALGEYNERLEKAGLTPVAKLPETPVMISADGRLLWRILDNLLGNAVKYAMPGTRLYVTLTADTHAIVTFRNISRDPLDVTPEELMERFVRGDSSRHTEGSGLGLSIAQSLAESMGGEFLLSVDGDLFKAAVVFPALPMPAAPEPQPSVPEEPTL